MTRAPAAGRLVIASGKGGTGKTTLAVAMAVALTRARMGQVALADFDVEQPNCAVHLPVLADEGQAIAAVVPMPVFGGVGCDFCGDCAAVCHFGALAVSRATGKVIHHEHLCHGCGACWLACRSGAVGRGERAIGNVRRGTAEAYPELAMVWGQLTTGEPLAVPVIQATAAAADELGAALTIIDAPPGTACALVETLRHAHAALMVTEPTPFGAHDLSRALGVAAIYGLPSYIVLNRDGIGDAGPIEQLSREYGAPILLRLPFARRTAALLAQGHTLLDVAPELEERLVEIWSTCLAGSGPSRAHVTARPPERPREMAVVAPAEHELSGARPCEVVVLSGKGGTGKTTVTAALAVLLHDTLGSLATCDCDVDAANLALLLAPCHTHSETFSGGKVAEVDAGLCISCAKCVAECRFGAVSGAPAMVDAMSCEGCGVCTLVCPVGAVTLRAQDTGTICTSGTAVGTMIHAELGLGQGNSGRLVAEVRERARQAATQADASIILSDGPPGLGCPVISALSGADYALLVTEPSPSALHDLRRTIELCGQLGVRCGVVVNKADLVPDAAEVVESLIRQMGCDALGRVPFDGVAASAAAAAVPLVERLWGPTPAVAALRELAERLLAEISAGGRTPERSVRVRQQIED